MSIILDALKKSESDRQRQTGPALFEVRVAPPRSALPPWAIAIAALFAVNLGIVTWMLLRHPAPPASAVPAANTAAAPASTVPAAPTAAAAIGTPAPALAAPPAVPRTQSEPADTPAAAAVSAGAAGATPGAAPALAATDTTPPANPDDYAPAREPPAQGAADALGHVSRTTGAGVPLYQQSAAAQQLPQLRLDLHAYAEKPQDRWVMINMHKLREGDSLPEGAHVERITPDGVVLSYQGSQFLLPRD